MTIVIVICLILVLLFGAWSSIVTYVGYKLLKSNFELQDRFLVYDEFFDEILETMKDDTTFLRSSVAQKLSAEIPEVKQLHHDFITFENKLVNISNAIKAYKMNGE